MNLRKLIHSHKPTNPHQHKKKVSFLFAKIIVIALLLLSVGVASAQASEIQDRFVRFFHSIPGLQFNPKPLSQSSQVLPQDVQNAIENLAEQQIKQEQAAATLPFILPEVKNEGFLEGPLEDIQIGLAQDPLEQAKLRIKKINRLINRLQQTLAQDKLEKAINLIQEIGTEIDKIVADPKTQTDREILTLQIEQYNRLQLIIQYSEVNLSFANYLKIEDARRKYLVSTAINSINKAPSLDAIHDIAVSEIAKIVGNDFAELKALEIITDFEEGLAPQAKEKLHNDLEIKLAQDFEKKMLKLPRDVRNRKLQSYIHYSFGDPLLQVKAFDHTKDALTNREIILGVEGLREVALLRLSERIFELEKQEDLDSYLDRVIQNPEDIKVLTEMQLLVNTSQDEGKKQKLEQMEKSVLPRIVQFFNNTTPDQLQVFFAQEPDLIDVIMVSNLEAIILSSPEATNEIKQQFKDGSYRVLVDFRQAITAKDADVHLLPANPLALVVLRDLKLDNAVSKNARLIQEHLLLEVNDPEIFVDYEQFILKNTQVNQILRQNVGQNFFIELSKKSQIVQKVSLAEKQQLYEIVQQITQAIFTDNSRYEKQLPNEIVGKIKTFKNTLSSRNIPKLVLPEGVVLPEIATLPHSVEHAIVQAAKMRIRDNQKTEEVKLDLTLTAKEMDVAEPKILSGNILYPLKRLVRRLELLLAFDPLKRVETLVRHNNEKTLEAVKLLEQSASRKNVNFALGLLDEVEKDFALLKASSEKFGVLKVKEPQRTDRLVNSIIKNGVARQTVFALIEDKVYGADYVRVEKIRQSVLKNGVDSLLVLTNGNALALVEKLENTVNKSTGSQFKELKAIELLVEIKRFQPEKIDEILKLGELRLIKQLETKLLDLPKDEREKELLAYAEARPGNPVRQFEAYKELVENFENKETVALAYKLEQKAVENLTEIVESITDQKTLQEFAESVVGNQIEDLEIVLEAEIEAPNKVIEDIINIVEEEIVQASPELAETIGQIEEELIEEITKIVQQLPHETVEETIQEENLLEETVEQIQDEIFSTPVGESSPVEGTLPETIQDEIDEIRQEIPVEQTVEVVIEDQPTVTVEDVQTPTVSEPASVPAPPPVSEPAPTVPGL